jgi:hypothetical protein
MTAAKQRQSEIAAVIRKIESHIVVDAPESF